MNKNLILSFTLLLITCGSYGMELDTHKSYGKKEPKLYPMVLTVPKRTNFKKRQVRPVEIKKVIKINSHKNLTNPEKAIEKKLENLIELCNELDNQSLQTKFTNPKNTRKKQYAKKNSTSRPLGTPMHKRISRKNTPGTELIAYQEAINQKKYSTAIEILPKLNSYKDQTILNNLVKSNSKKISDPFTNDNTWKKHDTAPVNKENFLDFALYFIDTRINQVESDQEKQNLNAIKNYLEEELLLGFLS